MSLVMALIAPVLIAVVGGSHEKGAVPVLRIQGLALIVSFLSTASAFQLVSLRRYRPLLIASACGLALNVLLAVVLVSAWGARGGALADVISEVAMATALTGVLMHAVPQHQITAAFVPPVLLAAAVSVSVFLLPVGSIARAVVATIIYFSVLLLTRTIPDEVIVAARRLTGLRAPA